MIRTVFSSKYGSRSQIVSSEFESWQQSGRYTTKIPVWSVLYHGVCMKMRAINSLLSWQPN